MKKSIFSATAIALAVSAGSASAADLPFKKGPPPYIAPGPVFSWTGFYAGLNAGGTWSASNEMTILTAPGFINFPVLSPIGVNVALTAAATANGILSPATSGFIGGGQVGYNYQFNSFVAGIEADIQGVASSSHSATVTNVAQTLPIFGVPTAIATTLTATKSLDYLGTVRGRLGWIVTPTLLVYGTGGLAYGGVSSSASIFGALVPPDPIELANSTWAGFGSFSDTRVGWTAGGGGEWMFMPNWSAKVEYLYYDLGRVTFAASPLVSTFLGGATFFAHFPAATTRFNGHIVRAGLNYHFHMFGGAPILASY